MSEPDWALPMSRTEMIEHCETLESALRKAEGRNESELRTAIQHACNCACAENDSNTPDFILAEYLIDCLKSFDKAVNRREQWYGREPDRLPGAFDPAFPAPNFQSDGGDVT